MLRRSSLTYVVRCYGKKTLAEIWVATETMITIRTRTTKDANGAEITLDTSVSSYNPTVSNVSLQDIEMLV